MRLSPIPAAADKLQSDFAAAVADDLNFSEALGALFVFVREVNVAIEAGRLTAGDRQRVLDALDAVDTVLGVLDPAPWRRENGAVKLSDEEVERLVVERQEARQGRDFTRADELRDRLAAQGIVVEDTPQGPRWKRQ